MSDDEIKEIIEAIGNLNDKYDAIAIDFLIFKAKYETSRSKNGTFNELVNLSSWARQFIIALVAALTAVLGTKFTFGG